MSISYSLESASKMCKEREIHMRKILIVLSFLLMMVMVSCDGELTTTEAITEVPTTLEPTTQTPTSEVPTTEEPTTEVPTTEEPTTEVLTTEEPTTEVPTTEVPTTDEPTTEAPTTEEPTTEVPTTEEPTTEEPVVTDIRQSYYQYSIYSTQNIQLLHLNITGDVQVFDLDNQPIDIEDVLVMNAYYEIKSSYILEQDKDIVEFYLVFNQQRTKVTITLNEKQIPFIISSSVVYTNGEENLVFQFELFDGFIRQIDGELLTQLQYSITDNILTISKTYVSLVFQNKNQFLINYVLEADQLVVGFISISNTVN